MVRRGYGKMALRTSLLCLVFLCFLVCSRSPTLSGGRLNLYPSQLGLTGVNLDVGSTRLATWFPVVVVRSVSKTIHPGFVIFLVLLSGDVSPNPGSVRFPCGSCAKPVKSNQKGIFCDVCCCWLHTKCIDMSNDEYLSLGSESDTCCCQACYSNALPFANVSSLFDEADSPSFISLPDLTNNEAPCFSLFYSNSRSLLPKIDHLRLLALTHKPLVISICESWLDCQVDDSELIIPGCTIVRRDRSRHGGGIVTYIHDSISFSIYLNHPTIEFHLINLKLKRKSIMYGLFYRPPSSDNSDLYLLEESLQQLSPSHMSSLVLVGDFNIDLLSPGTFDSHLSSIVSKFGLDQVVTAPGVLPLLPL